MKIEYRECIEKLIAELAMNRKNNKKCFFIVLSKYMKVKFLC